jgi:hypothetical protein
MRIKRTSKLRKYIDDFLHRIEYGGVWYSILKCFPYYVSEFWYKVEKIWKPKANVVKLPKIKWYDYYDIDYRMLHACFELLKHFVDKEHPFETIDWDFTDDHRHAAKEIKELYDWWEKYPYIWEESQIYLDKWKDKENILFKLPLFSKDPTYLDYMHDYVEWETKRCTEEQNNMERLAKIRNYLWT